MTNEGEREAGSGGLSRADVIRRAAGGGAGLFLLGGALPATGLRLLEAAAATPRKPAAPGVHRFVSRRDLRPPVVRVLTRRNGTADGYLFLSPPAGPGRRGGMIIDNTGELVFFHTTYSRTTMDFRPGLLNGAPVLTWWEGEHVRGVGKVGDYVVMDDSYREIARFPGGHGRRPDFHEVLLTRQNTLLVTAYETAKADLTKVGGRRDGIVYGGVVQELEVPSGRLLWEWRSLDHVAVAESMSDELGNPFDYFHINAIEVDTDGNLIISARNTWGVYKVDRDTGKVLWRLGGRKSDFAMGRGTEFAFQHDARSHDGGRTITIFDNGPDPGQKKPESRAIEIALDFKRKRATLARRLRHSPPLFARATGSQQVLPNGNALVTWGTTGWFTEYAPGGSVRLDAKLPKGGQNYRVYRFPWVGMPTDPPVLVRSASAGARMLHVSWNGATEVASWRLEAGSRAGRLAPGMRVPKRGFETKLAPPKGTRYAAIVALDAAGRPLGRSNMVRV